MADRFRSKGIVLTEEDRGEADQVFSVFTEKYGKIKVKGKSIRKIKSKLRAGISLFSLSEIEFVEGKTLKTLTDATVLKKHKNIKNNLANLKIAKRIGQATDKLIKGQEKDFDIFNLLINAFNYLDSGGGFVSPETYYHYYFWRLISLLGYQIDLYSCAKCFGKLTPLKIGFSNDGLLCSNCSEESSLFSETVKILRLIQGDKIDILKKLKVENIYLKDLERLSDNYLQDL